MFEEISIIPMLGLCNKLRTMVSGINIAKRLGARCIIYWEKSDDCNCNFSDLFEDSCLQDDVSIIENKSILQSVGLANHFAMPTFFKRMGYDDCIYNFKWCEGKHDIFKFIKPDSKKLLLVSCYQMYILDGIGGYLMPKEKLRDRIREITNKFGKHTIGIHIRGTDNNLSKKYSPFDIFVGYMTKVLHDNPDTMFYLATDNEEYKNTLTKMYGTRIITSPIELTRTSLAGMEGALIDLYCLSYTDYIIGSYYSSYSEIAAKIGGIKLYRAMKDMSKSRKYYFHERQTINDGM